MANGRWLNSDLLTSVKRRTFSPSNQATLTDSDILEIATEELHSYVVPLINGVREGYFEYYEDFSVSATNYEIRIPDRSVGGRINYVAFRSNNRDIVIPRVDPLDTYNENDVLYINSLTDTNPGYYIRNHTIVLRGQLNAQTVRVYYFARPGDLVETTDARQVITVNSDSLVLSAALGTLTTGVAFDIIRNTPGFVPLGFDQTATVSSATLTFAPPSGVEVGDWVALANQSPIPQIPYEIHPLLRERTVGAVLQALGFKQDAQMAFQAAGAMEAKSIAMITLRADRQQPALRPNRLFRSWRNA
jgi:hypothetical protein